MPFDEWVREVGSACEELAGATPRMTSDADDPAALRDYFDETTAVLGDHVDSLDAAGVPDDRADDAAEYVEIAERRRDAFADAAGSVEDNADLAVEVLAEDVQLVFDAEELALDLGIEECTSMDEGVDPDGGFTEQNRRDFIAGMMDASAITEEEAGCVADLVDADLDAGVLERGDFAEDPAQIMGYLEQCLTPERLQELAG